MASPTLAPSLFDGGTYLPADETAPPAAARSGAAAAAAPANEKCLNLGKTSQVKDVQFIKLKSHVPVANLLKDQIPDIY